MSEQRTDEETGNVIRTIYYVYDANGQPVGMKYNGVQYWYQKNMQGDVVRILNASGAEVVSYAYDAWGNHQQITDGSGNDVSDNPNHIANINPFRYRGYYYDTETGWYYLNTRYYDPNVGRFLSPDTILGANGGLLGYNLYAYCNNNPVMFVDPSGLCYIRASNGIDCYINDVVCGDFYPDWLSDFIYVDYSVCDEYVKLMNFIAGWESLTDHLHSDMENDLSIGYGHKLNGDKDEIVYRATGSFKPQTVTQTQAELILLMDISVHIQRTKNTIKNYGLNWNTNQINAVASVSYNHGNPNTIIKNIINSTDPYVAFTTTHVRYRDKHTGQIIVSTGLVNRRIAEYNIFMYGIYNSIH